MEYEDLYNWLQKRRDVSAGEKPVIVNIDLGTLLSRLLTQRNEIQVRDRTAPSPG